MSVLEDRATLWEAINRYVVNCGGDPSANVYRNPPRQEAVVAVERAIAQLLEAQIRHLAGR